MRISTEITKPKRYGKQVKARPCHSKAPFHTALVSRQELVCLAQAWTEVSWSFSCLSQNHLLPLLHLTAAPEGRGAAELSHPEMTDCSRKAPHTPPQAFTHLLAARHFPWLHSQSPIQVSRQVSAVSSLLSSACISNSFHPTKFPTDSRSMLGAVTSQQLWNTPWAVHSCSASPSHPPQELHHRTPPALALFMCSGFFGIDKTQTRGGTECTPVTSLHATATPARHTREWKNITEYPVLQHSTRYLKNKGGLNFWAQSILFNS